MSQDQFLHLRSKTDCRTEVQLFTCNGDGKYQTGVVPLTCRYGFWTQSSITIQFPPFLTHLNSNLLSWCMCLDNRVPLYVDPGPVRQPSLPSDVQSSSSRLSKMKPSLSVSEMRHVIKAYFLLTFTHKLVQPVSDDWGSRVQLSVGTGIFLKIIAIWDVIISDVSRENYTSIFRKE